MSDITLTPITSGYNLQKINDNFDKIEEAINEDVVHNKGGNNVMNQDLDMNSNQILNLPAPVNPTDPVRLQDMEGGSLGEANTASNVGAGAGIVLPKDNVDLPFKTFLAGSNVSLSEGVDTITISAAGGGGGPISGLTSFATMTLALASTDLSQGDIVYIEDVEITASEGKGFAGTGGVFYEVVLTASVTPNGLDIRTSVGDPTLSLRLKNRDEIQVEDLGVTAAGINRTRDLLATGNSEVTGGHIDLPTGRYVMSEPVSIGPTGVNNFVSVDLKGKGKMTTSLDFDTSTPGTDGVSFDGGVFYGAKDLHIWRAPLAGIKQGNTPVIWNHVKFENIRTQSNGTSGIEAEQGFMGHYDQVFSTNNGSYGFDFLGLHTSLHIDNCYAVSNTISGYKMRTVSYSCINACASDSNGQHGYDYRNSYAVSTKGSGAESNGRAGFYMRASDADGNNRNLSFDSLLGFQNNASNAGWANLLHMQCTDPTRQNTAVLTNSWGRQGQFGIEDVIVDGEGSYLVSGYNILEGGSKAQNKGYIQHLPRHALIRDLSVTTSTDVVGLKSPQGFTTTYGGEILVMASNGDFSSASARNCAVYKLTVCKAASGTYLDLVQATGDITGTLGPSEPSFTWTIVNDVLRATPIGLTSGTFNFEVLATGFVKTTDPLND